MTAVWGTLAVILGWAVVYFWLADRREALEEEARWDGRMEEVEVHLNGGFRPRRVEAGSGRPLRIHFTRSEDGEWWDDVEFPYLRIVRELPEGGSAVMEVDPLESGEYALFGAEGTMRGTLVVRDAGTGDSHETWRR